MVIRNDAVPEGNETFTLQITGARFGAEVGERDTMQLIIRASDEPYGALQFDSVSQLEIKLYSPWHASIRSHVNTHVPHFKG